MTVQIINAAFEKNKILDIIEGSTDDDLQSAIQSHIKSTSIISGVKYHDAIGAFFIRIHNIEDFKREIINPILTGSQNFTFTKYNEDAYKISIPNNQPAIRNGISEELAVKAEGLNKMIYYYTKREMGLLTVGQIHSGNSNVSHKHRRSGFLDIANVIKVIKYLVDNRIHECINPLFSFCRELIDISLSDEPNSPSECLEVKTVIGIQRNMHISDHLRMVTCFPYFPFSPELLKLKNLISHHTELMKLVSHGYFNDC